MNVQEMIYQFTKYLDTVSKEFQVTEKPDTETILLYLNIAMRRYLNEKYINGKSIKENTEIISKNSDDLINLIKRSTVTLTEIATSTDPYFGKAVSFDLSSITDYFHYIRSDVKVTRTVPVTFYSQFVPCEIINYDEVDVYLPNPFNYPIIEFPKIIFQTNNVLYIIYDSDTTIVISNGYNLTYLKIPKTLVISYTRTTCYTSTTQLFSVGDRIEVIAGTVTYNSTTYTSGQTFVILAGLLSVTFNSVTTGCLLEYYNTETTTCELAEYTHINIVRYAVDIFINEYKFRLQQKEKK